MVEYKITELIGRSAQRNPICIHETNSPDKSYPIVDTILYHTASSYNPAILFLQFHPFHLRPRCMKLILMQNIKFLPNSDSLYNNDDYDFSYIK